MHVFSLSLTSGPLRVRNVISVVVPCCVSAAVIRIDN
jgi:hypothetical protein